MNERIKELAKQAGLDLIHDKFMTASQEKFARLIVRECARVARAIPCPYEEEEVKQRLGHTWDMASLASGRSISKHFGLEE